MFVLEEKMHIKHLKRQFLSIIQVHLFLKQCFARVLSADVSLNISWKYPQIVSSEDCAKHCFKNEWTLGTFHSYLKFISYLQILKEHLNAGDSIVLGVGHDIDTRIFKMLHQLFT